ncbi:MAG: primosomal protein N' [Candidatus Omnitrophota bacterium]|nr:primosomal protein N' [Candidatus Omnitrophota bacterium]
MLYANVVFGLPIDGPFDYIVPVGLEGKISIGARAWVNFRNKKEVAYVVGLNNKTKIKKLKEIVSVIDFFPVLNGAMLQLTKELSEYYCCSWGEAIDAALPDETRKGKINDRKIETVPFIPILLEKEKENRPLFVQGQDRIPVYLREIKKVLAAEKSVIILCSNIPAVERLKEIIQNSLGKEVFIAFRKQPKELEVWEKIRQAGYCVVVGTRSSVFSPVNNLGVIIIDQPEDSVYKQEQSPHYHACQVGLMRAEICGAKVILGSHCLSLESFYLLQKGELDLEIIPPKLTYPQVKVIDVRRLAYAERKNKPMFSKFLLDAIQLALVEKGKVLLVVNRKGFATTVACHDCGSALKCPRCNINLVLHFELDKLKCHHCNFEMPVPKICPDCNAGYIKYFGLGTEKVESELARIFPQARLGQDIVVATSAIINHQELNFDLIGVMVIDNSLNRVDFRAAEKTFALLAGLVSLTAKKMIIQSANVNHHCFQALIKNDPQIFLKEELRQRKQLNFAPFKHMILLKIRGVDLEKVKKAAQDLFQRLNKIKTASLKLLSLNPGQPAQLRGNFYYQILMRSPSVEKASHFLKLHLKETHLSGIIVTVDVDPV